ncbi:MAG TPA: DinB family protein [Chryseosolibacter sp.]|nr:DinB family protein [Chryseosolibacter sp.]
MTPTQLNPAKWLAEIDHNTSLFKKEFGSLSAAQLNFKPSPDTWSIGQNIDHLIVINQSYYPVINDVIGNKYNAPFLGKIDFMVNWMGKIILDSVSPARKRKMKTFPIWQPSASEIPADIVERFEKHHAELKQMMAKCGPLLEKRTVISSPANRNIVYTVDKAFEILVTHERRHFEQAREVSGKLPR